MTPTKQQIAFADHLTANKPAEEIRRKMKLLEMKGKGEGFPMYEALKIVLERRTGK